MHFGNAIIAQNHTKAVGTSWAMAERTTSRSESHEVFIMAKVLPSLRLADA